MNLNSVFPSAFLTPQSPRAAAVASQHRSGSGGGEGGNANRWSLQQPTSLQAEAISPDGVSVGSGWKADSPGGYASIGEDTGQYNIGSTSAANRPASGVFRQVLQAPEKSRFGISSNSSSSIVEEPVSDYYVPGMTPRSKPQFHPFSTNISHSTPPGGALDSNTRRASVASVGLQKSAFRTEQGHNQTGIPYPDPDPQPYLPSHVRQLSGASFSADSRACHRASESSKLKNTSTRKETSMDDPIFSATTVSTIGGENELLRERSTYTPMSPRRARPQIDGNWASRGGPSYKDKDLATNESNDGYPMEPVDRSFNDVIHPSFKKPVPSRRYKRYHNYQLQDTTYFCHGRLLSGGDNILPFLGSIILLLGLGGLWIGTTGVWVWRDGLGGGGAGAGGKAAVIIFGYVLGVCFGAMMATALRDPGRSFSFNLFFDLMSQTCRSFPVLFCFSTSQVFFPEASIRCLMSVMPTRRDPSCLYPGRSEFAKAQLVRNTAKHAKPTERPEAVTVDYVGIVWRESTIIAHTCITASADGIIRVLSLF